MPPSRSPLCAMSAVGVSSLARSSTGSGIGQAPSPAAPAASTTRVRKASSLAMTPAMSVPSATTWAPVSVAMSTTQSGCFSLARHRPSPSTMRPSASVSRISTLVPSRITTTSLGRWAVPLGMFSARQR